MNIDNNISLDIDMTTSDSVPSVNRDGIPIGPIVGAIIGVLLFLILGVAIMVVVLYLVRRRTGGKYSTGRTTSEKKVYGMGKYKP